MDTPGSKSNTSIVVILLVLLAVCGLKLKHDWESNNAETSIAVSRQIESHYNKLFSDLDLNKPFDPMPRLQFTREQVRQKEAGASEKEKKAVYEQAGKLLDAMIEVADERKQALQVLLRKASQPRAKLDMAHSVTSSAQHFLQLDIRRANESLNKRKAVLDQLLAQVRNAETDWNSHLPNTAKEEYYSSRNIPSVFVTAGVSEPAHSNPLERRAYDQRKTLPLGLSQ
jgi:hypothetical protein